MFKYHLPRFTIITMPQRNSRKSTGLTEICEEVEDEEENGEDKVEENATDDNSNFIGFETSVEKMLKNPKGHIINLNTSDDPLKRFQALFFLFYEFSNKILDKNFT